MSETVKFIDQKSKTFYNNITNKYIELADKKTRDTSDTFELTLNGQTVSQFIDEVSKNIDIVNKYH